MSHVYFISDLHFGHERVCTFQPELRVGDCWRENMHHIIENWNKAVTKRDTVWVLGDVAFNEEGFEGLKELSGRKILVRGNHDDIFSTRKYLEVFDEIHGLVRYKGYWLSHCPIHHQEMRGKRGNIHGHLHGNRVVNRYTLQPDTDYINVCVEWTDHVPVRFSSILDGSYQRKQHEVSI